MLQRNVRKINITYTIYRTPSYPRLWGLVFFLSKIDPPELDDRDVLAANRDYLIRRNERGWSEISPWDLKLFSSVCIPNKPFWEITKGVFFKFFFSHPWSTEEVGCMLQITHTHSYYKYLILLPRVTHSDTFILANFKSWLWPTGVLLATLKTNKKHCFKLWEASVALMLWSNSV